MLHRCFLFSLLTVFTVLASCSGKDDTYYQAKSDEVQSNQSDQDSTASDTIPLIDEPYCIRRRGTNNDKELLRLQKQLKQAIKLHDTNLLLSILDSNIVSSHGGGMYGKEDFLRNWRSGGLWEQLEQIVQLGGGFESDSAYRYPYFCTYNNSRGYEKYTDTYPDPYMEYFTIKDTVFLYNDTLQSNVVAKLVNCFVFMDYSQNIDYRSNWLTLTTYKGKLKGCVRKSNVYRTGDYDLVIEKGTSGKWCVTSFAPYD